MSGEREYPGFHLFVQGCGVALTLAFAALAIYDEPGFLKPAAGAPLWHILDAVIVGCFLAVFVLFRDGGFFAFGCLISGTLAVAADAIGVEGEMNGIFQALATKWLLVGGIASLVLAIRNRRLNKLRAKLWGKP